MEHLPLQEIYDKTIEYLLSMPGPSVGTTGSCRYRGLNDQKCAVGFWIPDEKYNFIMEGHYVHYDLVRNALPDQVRYSAGLTLLGDLQMIIHDKSWKPLLEDGKQKTILREEDIVPWDMDLFRSNTAEVARLYNLTPYQIPGGR